jgi:hypothetical protein
MMEEDSISHHHHMDSFLFYQINTNKLNREIIINNDQRHSLLLI